MGRLDRDSEGLLFFTNDKRLNDLLLNPTHRHEREYWVQVEGNPQKDELLPLEKGIKIKNYQTLPAKVHLLELPLNLPERIPPIRYRKTIPTAWLSLTLTEGRNRQVRHMTAAIGYPTLRLVRVRIENILLKDLEVAQVRRLEKKKVQDLSESLSLPRERER